MIIKIQVIRQTCDYHDTKAWIKAEINPNATLMDLFMYTINNSTKLEQAKRFIFLFDGFHLKTSVLDSTLKDLKFADNYCAAVEIVDEFEADKLKIYSDDQIFSVEDLIKLQNEINWPWTRIVLGITDFFILLTAIITFLLNIHIAVPIVCFVLFVITTVLLFRFNKIFSKGRAKQMISTYKMNKKARQKIKDNGRDDRIPNQYENEQTEI